MRVARVLGPSRMIRKEAYLSKATFKESRLDRPAGKWSAGRVGAMVPGGASARQTVSIGWPSCGGASTAQLSEIAAAGRDWRAAGDAWVDLAGVDSSGLYVGGEQCLG